MRVLNRFTAGSCVFLAFSLITVNTLHAQPDEWFTTGTTWTYNFQQAFTPGFHQAQFTVTEQTNFAGRDCAKVEYLGEGLNPFSCLAVQPPYYLYESGDSVFYASENDGVFHLAYDLGAAIGDTWEYVVPVIEPGVDGVYVDTFLAEVIDAGTVEIDGQILKSIALQYTYLGDGDAHTTLQGMGQVIVVERIGSLTGFMVPVGDYTVVTACDGQFGAVVQCYESESLSYLNPVFESCALSVADVQANDGLKIFPNPTTGTLHLHTEQPVASVRVVDYTGKVVLEAGPHTAELSLESLASGIYLIRVQTDENMLSRVVVRE